MHTISKRILTGALAAGLFAAGASAALPAPKKFLAVGHANQNWGEYRRTISYYDVEDLNNAFDESGSNGYIDSTAGGGFTTYAKPLFSVFIGYEDSFFIPNVQDDRNYEELSAITTNPANGMTYVISYDSGTEGSVDQAGDTEGSMDLYQIDAYAIYKEHVASGNAKGTIYAPSYNTDYDGTFGFEAGHKDTTQPIDYVGGWDAVNEVQTGPIRKIGEIARQDGGNFFDHDIEYVNPETLMFLDEQDSGSVDERIAILDRVNVLPGSAGGETSDNGGYNNNAANSWETVGLTELNMDFVSGSPLPPSDAKDMEFVSQDGITGVWVMDADGGGDDFTFFEVDIVGQTAVKKELQVGAGSPFPTGFSLDEDPIIDATTNDAESFFVFADADGNLVIPENGFFEVPSEAPQVITREILDYDAADSDASGVNEIEVGAWGDSDPITGYAGSPSTDARFVAYDKGEMHLYFMDANTKGVYVVDADSNSLTFGTVLFEFDEVLNHFFEAHTNEIVTIGDMNGDGLVNAADIDAINDSTGLSALLQEQYDLTGDSLITGAGVGNADAVELVNEILGTEFGDANLDGAVDVLDLSLLATSFGSSAGWANGDYNGDGIVDVLDLSILATNFGFSAAPAVTAVPEPASLALLALGGLALIRRR